MTFKKLRKIYLLPFICFAILMFFSLFPSHSYAASEISLKAEIVTAQPGSEVNVPIFIDVNPGIASLKFTVKYDSTYLKITKVTFPKNSGTYSSVPEPYSDDQVINFVSPLTAFDKTGLFSTLTFEVNENASFDRKESISIEFEEDDIFDSDFKNVSMSASNGCICITDEDTESLANLPENLVVIEKEAFMNTPFSYINLPEKVTTIGAKAFANCGNLKFIYIPETTTSIAKDAFLNVKNLTILGEKGSYAEFFAKNNGFEFESR